MYQRLATRIREQLPALVDQYDARLREVPGYANLPQAARRDLEQHVLQLMAACLETGDANRLVEYIRERAQQVLTNGFQPEWFQQAVTAAQNIIAPLIKKLDENDFVWGTLGHAQTAVWELVAQERRQSAEQQQRAARYLYATVEATRELAQAPDLDTLCRRTVELAREKFDIERCGLYLLDESLQYMNGTFGTDDQGHTTDERGVRRPTNEFEDLLASSNEQLWVMRETSRIYFENEIEHRVGTGWAAATILRGSSGPIAVLFNDRALSGQPADTTQQEALAVYCSTVGMLIERKRTEEMLRENEERFKAIYEGSNDAVMLLNEKGFFACNPRTLEMFGFKTEAEFTAVHPADVSPPFQPDGQESLPAAVERIQTAYQQGFNRFEWIHRRTTGEDFPAEVLLSAFDLGGQRVLQATVRDITARNQAEEARRAALESEHLASERLRAIVAAADELIRTSDLEMLYRRSVELAREKIGVERCALYILDESREWVLGTYGTDDQGRTTDEHSNKEPTQNHQIIFAPREQQWVTFQTELKYWASDQDKIVGTGWNVATAIRSAAGPIGIMFNDAAISRKPYDESLQQALALYCSMLANIIENKRLESRIRLSLQQRNIQVQTSTEVAQEIASATELSELFKRVVTLVKDRFKYYHTQLFRYEPAKEAVVLLTGYGEIGQKMLEVGHQLQMGRGVVGTAAATGESILASDVRQDVDWRPNPYLPETRGELAVPIKWRDQVLGILDVQSDRAGALSEDDRLLLEGLCGQIASALESTRLLDRTETLYRISAQLSAAQTYDEVLNALRRHTLLQEADLNISVNLYDRPWIGNDMPEWSSTLTRWSKLPTGAVSPRYPLAAFAAASTLLRPDEPTLISDVKNDPRLDAASRELYGTRFGAGSTIFLPLVTAGKWIGYVNAVFSQPREFNDEAVRLLMTALSQASTAIESLRRLNDLTASSTQLSEALKIAKLAYWEYDVEKDLFLFNDQFYALFHTTVDQVGGYQISSAQYAQQFVHPEDLSMVGGEIERALNSTDRHYSRQLEHRILYVDGGLGYISVNVNIDRDEQGKILRYYGANQDITQSKLAELEFSRFKQGLEQASDAVFMTDVDGRIIYVNPAFERIYGYSRAEALGQTPRILKSGQLSQEFYQNFWQTLLNKQSVSGEKPNKTKDGRVIIIEDSNSPILDSSGNLVGFLSTHRDITERKQAEQRMAETLHETERLYAAVGHESWQTYRQVGQLTEGYLFDRALIQPADKVWEPEIVQALERQVLITSRDEQRAVAVAPLAVRGEAVGALGVYDDPDHLLSKGELQLIEAVSEQVALALESARLFEQTQISLADTRALFRFSELASRETEIRPIFDNVAQLLVEETGFLGAWISRFDPEAQVLRGIAGAGAGMGPDRISDVVPLYMQTPATITARTGVMIVVNDPLHDERLSDIPESIKLVIGKSIAVPVIISGQVDSIIAATRPIDGLDITEHDQRLLQTAAAQVAIAVQRARLFEQTQRDAEREHAINRVTSRIRNARSVDEVLSIAAQELRLATRASRSVVEILPATDQPASAGNGEGVKA